MSVAFTKEEDTEAAAAYLPERPISRHPNFVTQAGLARLDAAVASAREAVALAQASDDLKTNRSAMAQAMRDLRYFNARRASAQLVNPSEQDGTVAFGSLVSFDIASPFVIESAWRRLSSSSVACSSK
jgi:transcription elongation GreA/GreB family factor